MLKDCPQSIDNHAELVLMEPSPVLIYQISSNETRILIDLKSGMPPNSKEYMRDTIAPNLPGMHPCIESSLYLSQMFSDCIC